MNTLKLIEILTVVFSLSTIFLIILNQPSGQDTFGSKLSIGQTRRGFEGKLYNLAIISAAALFILVLASQILK